MRPAVPLILLALVPPAAAEPPKPLPTRALATWTNTIGMTFVRLPAGAFQMGSPDALGHASEHPRHQVTLSRPFLLGKHKVRVGDFRRFVEATGYRTEAERSGGSSAPVGGQKVEVRAEATWKNPLFPQSEQDPVVCVNWNDAKAFIAWLNLKEGTERYRLPTEAEWEYACRSGRETAYSFGEEANQLFLHGWFNGNAEGRTHPVGEKQPNAWGLHDMHGNVWEWCVDWYGEKLYEPGPALDPTGPSTGDRRCLRGGSWFSTADRCRSAFRGANFPTSRFTFVGFRVAASLR